MGILKKVLRAFNKKSYEADLVMAVYVQTSENRGPLVNDFIYAAIKTNCADRSDITIGMQQPLLHPLCVCCSAFERMGTECTKECNWHRGGGRSNEELGRVLVFQFLCGGRSSFRSEMYSDLPLFIGSY